MKIQENELGAPPRNNYSPWLAMSSAALVAAMTLASNVHAQSGAQPISAQAKENPDKAWRDTNSWWYSMKFNGGTITALKKIWMETFTNDNFVITESAAEVRLPPFEIRHVRLSELARCIAFLSQGALTVEVVDMLGTAPVPVSISPPAANIWRIGTPSAAEAPVVKMRAVAAPNLFNQVKIEPLLRAAVKIDDERLVYASISAEDTRSKIPRDQRTRVIPLADQRVVVLIGTENGIAGIESFIQASEQSAAESAQRFRSAK